MAEYIEREAVKATVRKRLNNPVIIGWLTGIIDTVPSADVAPVVHGRWVPSQPDEYNCVKHICSECGKYPLFMWTDYKNCNYCPNCGARMDGEG